LTLPLGVGRRLEQRKVWRGVLFWGVVCEKVSASVLWGGCWGWVSLVCVLFLRGIAGVGGLVTSWDTGEGLRGAGGFFVGGQRGGAAPREYRRAGAPEAKVLQKHQRTETWGIILGRQNSKVK